jgi:hypothetical protein
MALQVPNLAMAAIAALAVEVPDVCLSPASGSGRDYQFNVNADSGQSICRGLKGRSLMR